jgi:hypothetical protein
MSKQRECILHEDILLSRFFFLQPTLQIKMVITNVSKIIVNCDYTHRRFVASQIVHLSM